MALEVFERFLKRLPHGLHGSKVIAMGSAGRLADDFVDQPQGFEAMRRDAHYFGGFRRLVSTFPQDGGAALGRNDRVCRVLKHLYRIADRNRQVPRRTRLPQ